MTMDIATLGIRVDATEARLAAVELDRLGAAGGRTATSMSAAERASERASHQFNAMAGMAKVAAGAIAGIVFGKAIQEVASFETKLLSLKALTNANALEMKAMEKQARSLGASTAFSAQQTAEAQGVLASAGLKVNEILAATPKVLELAAAGSLDLAKAAEISTGTMKGLGLELTDLGRINDVFAKVSADTSTNVEDIGEAMKNVAPIAKSFGIGLEDISASIGILADNQIKGSEAGNNFKAMLVALGSETKDKTEILKEHGLAFSDLNIQTKGLQPVLEKLNKANLSGAEAIKLFGSDAAAVGLILANNAPKIDTFSTALEGAAGSAKKQSDILNQGLAKAWDALLGSLSEAALQFFDIKNNSHSLTEELTGLITTVTGVIAIYEGMGEEFAKSNNLTKEQYENLKNIASGLETVAAGAGGIAVLTAGIWAANTAMLAFNLASRANPLVLVATLGAAGIGMVIDKIGQQKKAQEEFMTSANTLDEQNLKIKTQIAKMVSLTPHGGGTGSSKETMAIETKNLEILIGQRTAIEAKIAAEKESVKVTEQANKDKPKEQPKPSGPSAEDLKAHEKAAKEAAKAQEALAKSFADTLSGLSLHNIELSKTPREHKEAELSAKGYTQAMVAQAMALYDMGTALEAKKKLHEDEKAQLDSLIDRYNKVTLSARDYYASTLTTTGPDGAKTPMPSANQAPIMAQFDKTASAEVAKKATDDATASLDAYNKKLDDANTKTSDLGAVTSAIFDGALGGISAMAGAFDAMVTSIAANTKALEENAVAQKINESTTDPAKKAANFTKYAKEEAKLNNDNVKAQLTGASQMAGAAATLFDKKSAAAKGFHAIEVGLSVLRLAMDAKEMASSIMKTGTNIMEGASKMFGQSGWFAFAGVAAMLALMAGLGFSGKGSSGGSSPPPPSDTGTGTVLGDSSAKSESLTRTNDLLKSIHASEYVQLRGINAGVNNLNRSILNTATKVFQGGGLSSISLTQSDALTGLSKTISTVNSVLTLGMSSLVSKIPLIGGIFDKVNNFLFGGKQTQTVTGQGIQTFGTSLSSVMSGKNVRANQYADIKTHTSGGLFGNSKDSYATSYQAVGGDIQKALNDVFSNVGTNLMLVAKSLGHGLTDTVTKAIIPAMRIDLMGLSGENAAKKLNNVISATMDKMSSAIFGKIVGQYQQLGEGMFETAVRVVAQIELVKDAVRQSGLSILEKDIISVSDTLVNAAGGLEAFQAQFETYYDKFYTDAEKQERLQTRLTETMKEAALILPTTRDGYRQLMEALDLTNKLDQQRYTILLELSGAADNYYSELEKSSKVVEKQRSLEIKIMELSGDAVGALIETRKDEIAALDETLRFSQAAVYALTDANKAVADATAVANKAVSDSLSAASKAVSTAVNDVSKAISNLSTLSQKLRSSLAGNAVSTVETAKKDRADAQAVLNAALEIANSGGSIDNFAGMDKALADISKPSEQLYATFAEYAIDQAHTGSTITQLADYADTQISMAQQQIDAINKTTSAVDTVAGSLVSLTEAQKNLATVQDQKDQIDKMLKNNVAVLSVSEAITQLSAALAVQNTTTQAIAVAQQAAKTTAAAELVMNTANTKAAASASALSTAKTSVQTASVTAKSLSEADAAAVVKTESNIKGLIQLRDVFASVGDWATYFAYQSAIDKANKKLALLTIAAANSATAAATAAQDALTGAPYAGLAATAAVDAAAAAEARAAYQTALVYSDATAAAVPNGSHKNGLDYVPFDGYMAELHKGERVLTAKEAASLLVIERSQSNNVQNISNDYKQKAENNLIKSSNKNDVINNKDNKTLNKANGSHANGLDYVPYDGYVAELHKSEKVLTANENLSMSAPNNQSNAELIMEIRMLRREVEELRSEAKAGNSAIAENTKTTSKTLIKWDIDGMPAVTV